MSQITANMQAIGSTTAGKRAAMAFKSQNLTKIAPIQYRNTRCLEPRTLGMRLPAATVEEASSTPEFDENNFDFDNADVEEDDYSYENPPEGSNITLTSSSSGPYEPPSDDEESRQLAISLARIAWETKADDVMVLHVAPLVYWTRYMVFATAFSRPQLAALQAKATKEAEEVHGRTPSGSGEGKSEWELLDYGDVVVHFMTPQQRDYYDLESFYGAAEELELPFMEEGEGRGAPQWEKSL